MLDRLSKSLRYLMTGVLEKPAEPPAAPSPLPSSAIDASSMLVMKDSFNSAHGKTTIEVRSDGIHIQSTNTEEHVIPLDCEAMRLQEIDEDIRLQITRKISLLVPELAHSQKRELLHHVFNVLSMLAQDQLPRVRQMIAEELSEIYNAPLELVQRLAWDEHLEVAAPILEFSPLLTEQDLLDIIAESKIPGVMETISRRKTVSQHVTEALVKNVTESDDDIQKTAVIGTLLENKGASFNDRTFDLIVEESAQQEIWHSSLLERPELTTRTINKIARFVSHSMISEMQERGMISHELAENLSLAVADRLQNPHRDREKEAEKLAVDMLTQGTLDNDYLMTALESGERDFVLAATALMADVPKPFARAVFESDDARAVTALAWKAGLPMRSAIQLQLKQAKIHYTKILYAKEGKHFPLSEEAMAGILREFSVKAA